MAKSWLAAHSTKKKMSGKKGTKEGVCPVGYDIGDSSPGYSPRQQIRKPIRVGRPGVPDENLLECVFRVQTDPDQGERDSGNWTIAWLLR